MAKIIHYLWQFAAVAFVAIVLVSLLILMAISASLIRNAVGAPITLPEYFGMLWRFASLGPIGPAELDAAVNVSQPLLIAIGTVAVIYPTVAMVWNAVTSLRRVIYCKTRSRKKNRLKLAEELATEISEADEICIISGDFSWFKQDGVHGLKALTAIVDHSRREVGKANIITFKSREAVHLALSGIDSDLRDAFIELVQERPHLSGLKLTIVKRNPFRKLYMISSTDDGEEQTVIINDRQYGRRLIDNFQQIACHAA